MLNLLHLIEIFAVALALHVVTMDEPERCGIDAVAQATAIRRAIGKDVPKVAVAMCGSDFGPDHSMGDVAQHVDVRGNDWLGEARPSAASVILVGRRKQR